MTQNLVVIKINVREMCLLYYPKISVLQTYYYTTKHKLHLIQNDIPHNKPVQDSIYCVSTIFRSGK